jgi:hypothetical protein
MEKMGISGRIAKAFIKSKLTPLMVLASLLLGIFAVTITPREEEPQIVVPMIDVMVAYPGASAREVEDRVTRPMEKFLWEIKGVEYIYSIVKPGMNLTIVRFYVGENMEDSIVNLYNKLMANFDKIPPGVTQPLVKPKSIDDVPILTLTLWDAENKYSGYELRRVAAELADELKKDGRRTQKRPGRIRVFHHRRPEAAGGYKSGPVSAQGLPGIFVTDHAGPAAGQLCAAVRSFSSRKPRIYRGNRRFPCRHGGCCLCCCGDLQRQTGLPA